MSTAKSILLIEDNEDDLFLMMRAFKAANVENPIFSLADGEQALEYLRKIAEKPGSMLADGPLIILLDLKMPKVSGFEVLKAIRDHPFAQKLTRIVLSSSNQASDMREAYRLGAHSYVVKPASYQELLAFISALKAYWLTFNDCPP